MESVKAGRILDNASYYAFHNEEKGSKRVDFVDSRVKYTITEGIKIFEIALANQRNGHAARGSAFWLEIQRKQMIPSRPGESMRNFWKTESRKGLENFLSNAMTEERRFCHAFKRIPQVKTPILQTTGPDH